MRHIQVLGFAAIAIGLLVMSMAQSFAQEEAIAEAIPETPPAGKAQPSVRPLTVSAGLLDDTVITGTLMDSTALNIKTAFGEASIPLSEVAGIRFPAAEDTSTTIVMHNGDSITGATDLRFVKVETSWGSATINGPNISTMLFLPGLVWKSVDGLSGKRWNLTEATKPAPTRANNVVQPASGTRIINPTIQPGQPQVIFGR